MRRIEHRQIEGFVHKQKKIISSARTKGEKIGAFGFWAGFLNGLKMTGVITYEKYGSLFKELEDFEELERKSGFSDKLGWDKLMEVELWVGFLNGLKATRAIAESRYKILLQNIKNYQKIA